MKYRKNTTTIIIITTIIIFFLTLILYANSGKPKQDAQATVQKIIQNHQEMLDNITKDID